MKIRKLSHDNSIELLKTKGYQKIEGKKLKGEKHKIALCSLFLTEYKETLTKDDINQIQVHYAEMLEVVRTLMISSKTNIKELDFEQNQAIQWYKNAVPEKQKLANARLDMLQKFYELLKMKTEAVKDQLKDVLSSFKQLVEAHKISFARVEQVRRETFKKLGGFSKGIYIESASKIKTNTTSYSM
ncbi:MAG: hypothetical protein IJ458_01215 [Clostridia bacterium]|nr:hypothetical protein [Clostridia bacterium]